MTNVGACHAAYAQVPCERHDAWVRDDFRDAALSRDGVDVVELLEAATEQFEAALQAQAAGVVGADAWVTAHAKTLAALLARRAEVEGARTRALLP